MHPKTLCLLGLFVSCLSGPSAAEEEDPLFTRPFQSLKDEAYVVETSEQDAAESLDRVSGIIDRGFASEDTTYLSPHHYGAGPFAQSEAYDSRQSG